MSLVPMNPTLVSIKHITHTELESKLTGLQQRSAALWSSVLVSKSELTVGPQHTFHYCVSHYLILDFNIQM